MIILRKILGSIILFFNWVFTPKGIKRKDDVQIQVDKQTENLKLYQFHACPFCVKVRRAMKKLSLNIELRDAKEDQKFRSELETEGGKIKVPCLRIVDNNAMVRWMYESSDIIAYLKNNFEAEKTD